MGNRLFSFDWSGLAVGFDSTSCNNGICHFYSFDNRDWPILSKRRVLVFIDTHSEIYIQPYNNQTTWKLGKFLITRSCISELIHESESSSVRAQFICPYFGFAYFISDIITALYLRAHVTHTYCSSLNKQPFNRNDSRKTEEIYVPPPPPLLWLDLMINCDRIEEKLSFFKLVVWFITK